jgi:hypothetical protein
MVLLVVGVGVRRRVVGMRAVVMMGMGQAAAVAVAVSAEVLVVERGIHALNVRSARDLDDGVLENDADDPGDGHHVNDGQFAVPALECGESA